MPVRDKAKDSLATLTAFMSQALTNSAPVVLSIDKDIFVQWVSHTSGLQIEITGALPSSRQLSPRRMQTMRTLGFSAPIPETSNWWMVVDPQSLEHAASAVMRALLMVLEVLPQRLTEALTNCTQQPHEPRPAEPDVVGSIEIPDEDGRPTGVALLLTRGMDAAGLAETFKADRRGDLDSGAIIRRPGEADDAFAARIQAVIDTLVGES